MSSVAPSADRVWLQALGLLVAASLAAALVGLALRHELRSSSASDDESARPIAAPVQPPWDIDAWAAGALGEPSKAAKRVVQRQRDRVVAVIERSYEALFLQPQDLKRILGSSFSPTAARALAESGAGLPPDPSDVQIVRRSATIGIDSAGARQAAARVTLVARLRSEGREMRLTHRATLWMERSERGWKVVAFDLSQKRLN